MVVNIARLRRLDKFEKHFWYYWTKDLITQIIFTIIALPLVVIYFLGEGAAILIESVSDTLRTQLLNTFDTDRTKAILHPLKHRQKLREAITQMRQSLPKKKETNLE